MDEGLEARAADMEVTPDRTGRNLDGYVAIFNSRTRIPDRNGDFEEELKPGFADRSLKEHGPPVMQFDHGRDPRTGTVPIGVWRSWERDGKGYRVRGELHDNELVEPIRQALRSGALNGLSFRFKVGKGGDRWERRGGRDVDLRHVLDADVHEAGPVVFPAYKDAKVSLRGLTFDVPVLRSYDPYDDEPNDSDAAERTVAAYAVTWRSITEQRGNDGTMQRVRFDHHAFDEWLAEWRADGKPPWPILREHGEDGHSVPVGHLVDAVPDSYGLWTIAEYHDTPEGRAALDDIVSGRLKGYSNHAKVVETRDADDGVVEIRTAVLVECGPTEKPFDRGATITSAGGVLVETRAEFTSAAEVTEFVRIQTGVSTEDLLVRIDAEQRGEMRAAEQTVNLAYALGREVAKARRAALEAYKDWTRYRRGGLMEQARDADRDEFDLMAELRTVLTFSPKRSPLGEAPMVRQVLAAAGAPDYTSPFRGRGAVRAVLDLAGLGR